MYRSTPSLTAVRTAKQHERLRLLAPLVRDRLVQQRAVPEEATYVAASALTGAALSCVDAALEEWAESGGAVELVPVFDQAMALVAALSSL
jgi:hypothetical protein